MPRIHLQHGAWLAWILARRAQNTPEQLAVSRYFMDRGVQESISQRCFDQNTTKSNQLIHNRVGPCPPAAVPMATLPLGQLIHAHRSTHDISMLMTSNGRSLTHRVEMQRVRLVDCDICGRSLCVAPKASCGLTDTSVSIIPSPCRNGCAEWCVLLRDTPRCIPLVRCLSGGGQDWLIGGETLWDCHRSKDAVYHAGLPIQCHHCTHRSTCPAPAGFELDSV